MAICSEKRRKTAATGSSPLPEEMMTEVFLLLPVRSLLRFRAVCRSWATTLSSDELCALPMAKPDDDDDDTARPAWRPPRDTTPPRYTHARLLVLAPAEWTRSSPLMNCSAAASPSCTSFSCKPLCKFFFIHKVFFIHNTT